MQFKKSVFSASEAGELFDLVHRRRVMLRQANEVVDDNTELVLLQNFFNNEVYLLKFFQNKARHIADEACLTELVKKINDTFGGVQFSPRDEDSWADTLTRLQEFIAEKLLRVKVELRVVNHKVLETK